jgi:transposase InsO family protein
MFPELEEVRELIEQWVEEYYTRRLHKALGNLTSFE